MAKDEIIDFQRAKQKHVHARRDKKVKDMRSAFKKARQAALTPAERQHEKKLEKRLLNKKNKSKNKKKNKD